jgi:hypothetical protein
VISSRVGVAVSGWRDSNPEPSLPNHVHQNAANTRLAAPAEIGDRRRILDEHVLHVFPPSCMNMRTPRELDFNKYIALRGLDAFDGSSGAMGSDAASDP